MSSSNACVKGGGQGAGGPISSAPGRIQGVLGLQHHGSGSQGAGIPASCALGGGREGPAGGSKLLCHLQTPASRGSQGAGGVWSPQPNGASRVSSIMDDVAQEGTGLASLRQGPGTWSPEFPGKTQGSSVGTPQPQASLKGLRTGVVRTPPCQGGTRVPGDLNSPVSGQKHGTGGVHMTLSQTDPAGLWESRLPFLFLVRLSAC